ncbi:D-alanyl-D-alanine carboxypeptidase [Lactobacillus buchneri]|nr:D-alanyl-D-alanine carboxypeptidase [Lentilactobacillus parabuchneri]MCT3558584.1 D-alanyl-D-alanine carboxypeptidase [Lentilactobacillus buchneri]PUD95407.1 D-alanyl-D-alanine carboxypeptidase [Levilactobacillus brevis]MCT3561070.1 D-alanyl-D-alanine carboxypeptidase [Lentilactobacillus buchneri]MQM78779.1 D-alanyl-D-alanine carboxypeptidase [Lentilactobacillus buchneri]
MHVMEVFNMLKKSLSFLLLLGAIFLSLASVGSVSANTIPSNYSFDGSKFTGPIPYYSSTKSQKAYIWNNTQTKRIHNLKNYPNTVWLVSNAFVKPVKGKNEVYYKLYSAYNKKVKGIAWYGYFKKSIIKLPVLFNSQQAYLNDLNSNKALKLTRLVAKLFPNSKINLNLSKSLYVSLPQKTYLLNGFTSTKTIDLNSFNSEGNYTYYERMAPSKAVKLIDQRLTELGYDQDKRNSMSNYDIGLDIVGYADSYDDQRGFNLANQYRYPVTLPDFRDMRDYGACSIQLGIPK